MGVCHKRQESDEDTEMPHSYDSNSTFSLKQKHRTEQNITDKKMTLKRRGGTAVRPRRRPRDPHRRAGTPHASQGHMTARSFKLIKKHFAPARSVCRGGSYLCIPSDAVAAAGARRQHLPTACRKEEKYWMTDQYIQTPLNFTCIP